MRARDRAASRGPRPSAVRDDAIPKKNCSTNVRIRRIARWDLAESRYGKRRMPPLRQSLGGIVDAASESAGILHECSQVLRAVCVPPYIRHGRRRQCCRRMICPQWFGRNDRRWPHHPNRGRRSGGSGLRTQPLRWRQYSGSVGATSRRSRQSIAVTSVCGAPPLRSR